MKVVKTNFYMLELESPYIATASVEGQSNWTWSLKVDDFGLYRWYLDGVAETNIRGGTRPNAEYALRRFVEHSLNGKLKITEFRKPVDPKLFAASAASFN